MKTIPLTQGFETLVDDKNYDRLNVWNWQYLPGNNTGYAVRWEDGSAIYMHRVIAETPDDLFTDHRDGNGLNNQEYNLRTCTKAQNKMNERLRKDNITGFRGVSRSSLGKKYRANIQVDGKRKHLGYYDTPKEAALEYNKAASQYYGEFARLNVVI